MTSSPTAPQAKTTAVATLYRKDETLPDNVTLQFQADYNDARNKEWAKYTPALALQLNVVGSVAENFELGARYILTLERADTTPCCGASEACRDCPTD